MFVVKNVEEICLYNMLKNCNLDDFKADEVDQSLYCFVDEFISNENQHAYYFVNVQRGNTAANCIITVTGAYFTEIRLRTVLNLMI